MATPIARRQRRAAERARAGSGVVAKSRERQIASVSFQKGHPHDTFPGRSAREWFAFLRPHLLNSRPLLSPARVERPGEGGRDYDKPRWAPAVYGPPTFRNRINEEGDLV